MNKENIKYSYQYPKTISDDKNLTINNLLKFKDKSHKEIFKLIFIEESEHIGIHLDTVTKQTNKLFFIKNKLSHKKLLKELSI